jgi:hypothetical protein
LPVPAEDVIEEAIRMFLRYYRRFQSGAASHRDDAA